MDITAIFFMIRYIVVKIITCITSFDYVISYSYARMKLILHETRLDKVHLK